MGMPWPLESEPLPFLPRSSYLTLESTPGSGDEQVTASPTCCSLQFQRRRLVCPGWRGKGEWPGSWASRHLRRACCTGTNKVVLEGHWEHREGTDKWASKVKGNLNRRQKNTPGGGIANKVPRPKTAGCMDTREKWVLRGDSRRNILGTDGGSGPQA